MTNFIFTLYCNDIDEIESYAKRHKRTYSKQQIEDKLRIHDDFWNSLNERQKKLFLSFEKQLGEEALFYNETVYAFAFQKGLLVGFFSALDLE